MSKLAETLQRAQRGGTAAIGFATAATATKVAPLLLVARLSPDDHPGVTSVVAAGADAWIFAGRLPSAEVKSALAQAPERPWGLVGDKAPMPSIEEIKQAGADFVIVSAPEAPAAWMALEEGPGWVLEVNPDWGDSLLRAAESLSLDALYLAEAIAPTQLTVERALGLRRMAQLAQRPLLVSLQGNWGSADLQALMAVGGLGVVVEGEQCLKELRPILDQLPRLGRPPRGPREAMLPHPQEALSPVIPVEEEE